MTDEQIREWAKNLAHRIFQPNFGDVSAGIETAASELLAMHDLLSTQAMLEKGERDRCRHGWRGSVPKDGARIQTPCPACGAKSLFIGDGGHLTCARVPNDHNDGCWSPSVEETVNKMKATAPSNHRDAEDAEKYRKLGPPIPAGKALEKFVTLVDRAYKMMEMAGYQIAEHDPKHNNPIIAWMADAREALHIDSLKDQDHE